MFHGAGGIALISGKRLLISVCAQCQRKGKWGEKRCGGQGREGGGGEIGAINYSARSDRTGPRPQIAPEGKGGWDHPAFSATKECTQHYFLVHTGKRKKLPGPGGQCVWISWHLITVLLHLHLFPSWMKYNLRSWPLYKRQFCVLTAGAGVPPSCIWVIMCGRAVPHTGLVQESRRRLRCERPDALPFFPLPLYFRVPNLGRWSLSLFCLSQIGSIHEEEEAVPVRGKRERE